MTFNFAKYMYSRSQTGIFNDNDANRVAAFWVQGGQCYVTGRLLWASAARELHHRTRRYDNGKDEPENLILLYRPVHRLVHTGNWAEAMMLMDELQLTPAQVAMVNQLRVETHAPFMLPYPNAPVSSATNRQQAA